MGQEARRPSGSQCAGKGLHPAGLRALGSVPPCNLATRPQSTFVLSPSPLLPHGVPLTPSLLCAHRGPSSLFSWYHFGKLWFTLGFSHIHIRGGQGKYQV
jgi:hypothetical protein